MSFLIIIFIVVLWAIALFFLAYIATYKIKQRKGVRAIFIVVLMGACFTLPIRDEIKGEEEFEALCAAGGVYKILPEAQGKKFDFIYSSTSNKKLDNYSRPVEEMIVTYTDSVTGKVIATVKVYFAKGGWLVRRIGFSISSTEGPLLGRSQCFPTAFERNRLREVTNNVLN